MSQNQSIRSRCRPILNGILSTLETFRADPTGSEAKPIFIVGPPRSGTTLLYQALTDAFDVAYLSNRHAKLWGAPSWIERFGKRRERQASDFESRFGATEGPDAPSECGEFWYRFFRRKPQYTAAGGLELDARSRFQTAVKKFEKHAKRPVVFKNTVNSARIGALASCFPGAIFIVSRRDLVDNALSILEGRRQNVGSIEKWWSARPRNIAELLDLDPHAQVVEQVKVLNEAVQSASEEFGASRFFLVEYEEFCEQPRAHVAQIAEFARKNGIELSPRFEIPESFEAQTGKGDAKDRELIVEFATSHA